MWILSENGEKAWNMDEAKYLKIVEIKNSGTFSIQMETKARNVYDLRHFKKKPEALNELNLIMDAYAEDYAVYEMEEKK